jgi:hypothetical protein
MINNIDYGRGDCQKKFGSGGVWGRDGLKRRFLGVSSKQKTREWSGAGLIVKMTKVRIGRMIKWFEKKYCEL